MPAYLSRHFVRMICAIESICVIQAPTTNQRGLLLENIKHQFVFRTTADAQTGDFLKLYTRAFFRPPTPYSTPTFPNVMLLISVSLQRLYTSKPPTGS